MLKNGKYEKKDFIDGKVERYGKLYDLKVDKYELVCVDVYYKKQWEHILLFENEKGNFNEKGFYVGKGKGSYDSFDITKDFYNHLSFLQKPKNFDG